MHQVLLKQYGDVRTVWKIPHMFYFMTTYPRLRPLIFQLLQQLFLRGKEGIRNTYFGRNLLRAQRKVCVKRWE
jgi:hypothetical protein